MNYVVSDIHGEYDRYLAMLSEIGFSSEDTLYLIGDAIDRGAGGIDILRDVMKRDNIIMLLGNHERMCLQTLGPKNVFGARELWQYNGGSVTWNELLYHMPTSEKDAILRFLDNLPVALEVEVDGQQFYLVHGFPANNDEDRVWSRPQADTPNPLPDGQTLIIGHTPVCYLQKDPKQYCMELEKAGGHMRIAHRPGFIDIDCGCGNVTPARRLACLRLEDMTEYYV